MLFLFSNQKAERGCGGEIMPKSTSGRVMRRATVKVGSWLASFTAFAGLIYYRGRYALCLAFGNGIDGALTS